MNFSHNLINWYYGNCRDLPWRKTNNPYHIWLSEIILQQTKVAQGLDYYLKFIHLFPTVYDLSNASEDEVLKAWQGLGYYSRARNLHATAKTICNEFGGKFPEEYDDLIKLKGVGSYTASAISSFAFNKPFAVVDGNVYRVLSRLFNIDLPIDTTTGKKHFEQLAQELMDSQNHATHNQAIMEFGALFCLPNNPNCEVCIFQVTCLALKNNTIGVRPVKGKKRKPRVRYFNYLIISDQQNLIIEKRTKNDIWKNMFQFPLIESNKQINEIEITRNKEWVSFFNNEIILIKHVSSEYKHALTHQTLKAKFWEIEVDDLSIINRSKQYKVINKSDFQNYPVSKLIDNYIIMNKPSFAKG